MRDRDHLIQTALDAVGEASDAIVKYHAGRDHQIRFSNGQIDIAKQWVLTKVSIFIAMGRKVGSTDIESPTEETIKARASDLLALTKGMEESQLYQGIAEGEFKHRPMPQLLDPEIEGFAQEAPRLVGQVVDAAE
jgi:predicted Zn-dependent protease